MNASILIINYALKCYFAIIDFQVVIASIFLALMYYKAVDTNNYFLPKRMESLTQSINHIFAVSYQKAACTNFFSLDRQIFLFSLHLLKSDDYLTRGMAADLFGICKDPQAIKALIDALISERRSYVKSRIIIAIGRYGQLAKPALPLPIKIMSDPTTYNRLEAAEFSTLTSTAIICEAARCIAKIGPESANPLIDVIKDHSFPIAIRRLALATLINSDSRSASVMNAIIDLATDTDQTVRLDAIKSLLEFDHSSQSIRRSVLARFADASGYVRVVAAASYNVIDPDNVLSVPLLIKHIDDPCGDVRWRAITELGLVGHKAQSAVPKLVSLFDTTDEIIRLAAVRAIGRVALPSNFVVISLIKMTRDKNPNIRLAADESLIAISKNK